MTQTDSELLRQHHRTGSEAAFAELARRYLPLVYGAALRQTRRAQTAEDVTQAVFLVLWQKAAGLADRPSIGAWLLTVTRHAAIDAMRRENCQHRHEQAAAAARAEGVHEMESAVDQWDRLSPLIDQAMSRLAASDRQVLTLRYFQDMSLAEVGRQMRISEEAARKRATRALAGLRKLLSAKGVTASSSALGVAIAAHSLVTPPAALAASVAAIPGAAAAGSACAVAGAIAKGAIKMMFWVKLKIAATVVVCVAATAGLAEVTAQQVGAGRGAPPVHRQSAPAPARTADGPADVNAASPLQVAIDVQAMQIAEQNVPPGVMQLLDRPQPASLGAAARQDLLQAVTAAGADELAAPRLVMLSGTEAEIKALSLRRYVDSLDPQKEKDAQGRMVLAPHGQDQQTGLILKVMAEVAPDGRSARLRLQPQLSWGDLPQQFTFNQEGTDQQMSVQTAPTQQFTVQTTVDVPDGQTVVLGGRATRFPAGKATSRALLLVRSTIVPRQPARTAGAAPARDASATSTSKPITLQVKLLTLPVRRSRSVVKAIAEISARPFASDTDIDPLLAAAQNEPNASIVTAPSLTIDPAQSAPLVKEFKKATQYVAELQPRRDAQGNVGYQPILDSVDDGITIKAAAAALSGQDSIRVSASILLSHLSSLERFNFVSKPMTLAVQEPTRQIASLNLDVAIPEKNWLVVGPLQLDTDRETSTSTRAPAPAPAPDIAELPVLSRLLSSPRDSHADLYILIRPQIVETVR